MRRGKQHVDPRSELLEKGFGITTGMTGAIIHDQMNALCPPIGVQQAPHGGPKMFTIVLVQAFGPHPSIIERESDQQIDSAMTQILKLLPFDPTGLHPLGGGGSFKHLNIGFFIQGNHHFAALPKTRDPFVIPENFDGSGNRHLIPHRRLPITRAMRLQASRTQDVVDRGVSHTADTLQLADGLLQTAC